jgi:glutamyl-tRNA synthetase
MALLSLMARLGSADPVTLRTTHEDLVEGFDIARFGAAPTKFDEADLFPLTARYLHALPLEAVAPDLAAAGVPEELQPRFWKVVRENIATRAEIAPWWALFRDGPEPLVAEEDRAFVAEALALLPDPPWDETTWSAWTAEVKARTGRSGKSLFMPLRKALTGMERGPEMADVLPLLRTRPTL